MKLYLLQSIEIQHGLISDSHNQYSPDKFIGKHTMPDYLMCYNDYVKTLTNKNYIDSENICLLYTSDAADE